MNFYPPSPIKGPKVANVSQSKKLTPGFDQSSLPCMIYPPAQGPDVALGEPSAKPSTQPLDKPCSPPGKLRSPFLGRAFQDPFPLPDAESCYLGPRSQSIPLEQVEDGVERRAPHAPVLGVTKSQATTTTKRSAVKCAGEKLANSSEPELLVTTLCKFQPQNGFQPISKPQAMWRETGKGTGNQGLRFRKLRLGRESQDN